MSDAPPPYLPPPQPPPHQPPPGFPNAPGGYGAPPPEATVTAPPNADIRPKTRWFWIGGGIMILGIVGAIAFGVLSFFGISDKVDDFARVSEGSDTVRIDSTGEYVIYTEDPYSSGSVEIVDPDGRLVPTALYLNDLTYDFNGRSGRAAATFDAVDTGRYTITTDVDVAIGTSIAGDLIRTVLIPFVIAGLAFLVGLIVIVVTAVKRSGSKKRAAIAA